MSGLKAQACWSRLF